MLKFKIKLHLFLEYFSNFMHTLFRIKKENIQFSPYCLQPISQDNVYLSTCYKSDCQRSKTLIKVLNFFSCHIIRSVFFHNPGVKHRIRFQDHTRLLTDRYCVEVYSEPCVFSMSDYQYLE